MITPDSGVFPESVGYLKDVALVAQAIDHGLKELETVLSSVENLMPNEENQPLALEAMTSVEQEVKDMEEASSKMLVELQKMLSVGQRELQKSRETNKSIDEGMSDIENILVKYGYDGSKMPAYTAPNLDEEANMSEHDENEDLSEDDESSVIESGTSDSPTTMSLQKNVTRTPGMQKSRSKVEIMAGAEITPLVLSSKLLQANESKSASKLRVSPNNPFKAKTPPMYSNFLSPLVTKEESVPQKSAESCMSRPVRPVLSTVSF